MKAWTDGWMDGWMNAWMEHTAHSAQSKEVCVLVCTASTLPGEGGHLGWPAVVQAMGEPPWGSSLDLIETTWHEGQILGLGHHGAHWLGAMGLSDGQRGNLAPVRMPLVCLCPPGQPPTA